MSSSVIYNEFDAYPAQWLRNLVAAGHIASGTVDERSIADLKPEDVAGYTQTHFFAGIGVWSYALRLAGWPDDRPVWTGSCPCQPFSAAGKRGGTNDPRHLWPEWFRLVRECRPSVIFGEQVASRDGLAWLDIVYADLEGAGYSVGALDLCAAGFGAPHIRQRFYFVAVPECGRREGQDLSIRQSRQVEATSIERGSVAGMADLTGKQVGDAGQSRDGTVADASHGDNGAGDAWRWRSGPADNGGLGDAGSERRQQDAQGPPGDEETDGRESDRHHLSTSSGPTNGFWADAEWLPCSDGKARPTQPGLFPLAHGATSRVGRLRAYGNAICAPQAAEFIRAYMEGINERQD